MQEVRAQGPNVYERFDMLRFPLIVLVVYLHNGSGTVRFANAGIVERSSSPMLDYFVAFLSDGVARVAVPLFFLMAGYLFFRGVEWSRSAYTTKLRSRLRSLLIPYLFWNVLLFVAVWLAQRSPAMATYFGGSHLGDLASFGTVDAILGITKSPISYQFWFIRDLMVLVVATPLIYLTAVGRWTGIAFALVLLALWVADAWPIPIPAIEATCFFYLGCWAAIGRRDIFLFDKIWLPALTLSVAMFAVRPFFADSVSSRPLLCGGIICGLVAALAISDFAARNAHLNRSLSWLATASFFLFAVHEPILTASRKLLARFISSSELAGAAGYLLLPLAIAVFGVVCYRIGMLVLPRLTSTVTGGRR